MAFKFELRFGHPPIAVVGKLFETPLTTIPQIGTGSAYTAADAFGGKFVLDVPRAGSIDTALFVDKDNEGLETDMVLFNGDFVASTDNAAFAPTDDDMQSFVGVITFSIPKAFNVNQVFTVTGLGLAYNAPAGKLYCQCVARGAPNIAAANIPMIKLVISPYG